MEKWILMVTLGGLGHAVDVHDSEKQCIDTRNLMAQDLQRRRIHFLAVCVTYEEFVRINRKNIYTLR